MASGRLEPKHVVAVGLYGEQVRVSHGSGGGWHTFGGERVVTRSKGNVLDDLDNRPALAPYQESLGDRAAERPGNAPRFPWSVRGAQDGDRRVARTVIATVIEIDEAAQALTLAAEVPVGSHVRLMHVDLDRLVQGAQAGAAPNARFEGPVLGETG